MLSAGQLDRRLTIQQSTTTRDASGGAVVGYANQYTNVPCMIKPFTGREKFFKEGAREVSYRQYRFVIRYIAGITEKHRIVFEGANWDILYIAELTRRDGLEITAQVAK